MVIWAIIYNCMDGHIYHHQHGEEHFCNLKFVIAVWLQLSLPYSSVARQIFFLLSSALYAHRGHELAGDIAQACFTVFGLAGCGCGVDRVCYKQCGMDWRWEWDRAAMTSRCWKCCRGQQRLYDVYLCQEGKNIAIYKPKTGIFESSIGLKS